MIDQETTKQLLEEIAERAGGILRPEDVVLAATPENHPLHEQFQWNNTTAAHAYRLDQARALIRGVKVVIKTSTVTVKSVFYVRDPRAGEGEQGYTSLPRLRSDKELAEEAMAREFSRIREAAERARNIALSVGLERQAARAHMVLRAIEPIESDVDAVVLYMS